MKPAYNTIIAFLTLSTSLLSISANNYQWIEDTLDEIVVQTSLPGFIDSLNPSSYKINIHRLEIEQHTNYKDLSIAFPNLYIPDYGSRMTSSIYVRGIGARIDNPVLGVYIDGIGIANKNSYDFDLFDIRNISMYMGPQGTYLGKNTTGGVLRIETLSPLRWQGTRMNLGYANHNNINAKLSHYRLINKKKTNPLFQAIAFASYFKHSDGFFLNRFNNQKADNADELGFRTKIEGERNQSQKISLMLNYNYVAQNGFPYHLKNQPINHNDPCAYNRHNINIGNIYTITKKNIKLTSSTSYQLLIDKMTMDQDFLPLSYFNMQQKQQEHYACQELIFKPIQKMPLPNKKNTTNKTWDWVWGLHLCYTNNNTNAPVNFLQTGIDSLIIKNANNGIHTAFPSANLIIQENDFTIESTFKTHSLNLAGYHNSYFMLGNWRLDLGLRLDFEYKHFNYVSQANLHYKVENSYIADFKNLCSSLIGKTSLLYIEPLPKFSVSYTKEKKSLHNGTPIVSKWKTFITISEGYKGGGFNSQLFSDLFQNTMMQDMMNDMGVQFANKSPLKVEEAITYKPERCLNFELGWSSNHHLNNTLIHTSMTLYDMEVFNLQLTVFPKQGLGRRMTNAGRSRSLGTETNVSIVWKNWMYTLSYGFTSARFVKFNNGQQTFDNNFVPYIPQHTLNGTVEYTLSLQNKFLNAIRFNVNINALGPIYWNEENTEKQPFYPLLNVNIAFQMRHVILTLWAKNVTKTHYDVFRFVSMGNSLLQSGKPLTFGGKISVDI